MGRKKAMAFNAAGPTANYLSVESLNRIMNRQFPAGVSLNFGEGVKNGIDFTYKPNRGSFRKLFSLWDEALRADFDMDCYRMGYMREQTNKLIECFVFYGYKITVDYFDENAIIDFVSPVYKDAVLEYSFGQFLVLFSRRFKIKVINEHLLNMFPLTQ